ncbi:MAG TPA: hypothetical protein VN947_02845 [Polyangia bacterium]|nr:hypothetical protein [Polyangia bacterium]
MRATIVAFLLLLAGCSGGGVHVGQAYDDMGCKISCDKCPPQSLCVGAPYNPVCLPACTVTANCDVGTCALILSTAGVRVCIGGSSLTACEPVTCDNPAQCLDDLTALQPLPKSLNACGWEPIHCDSGCDSATGKCK